MRPLIEQLITTIRSSASTRWSRVRQLREDTRSMLLLRRLSRRSIAAEITQARQQQRAEALIVSRNSRAADAPTLARESVPSDELLAIDVMRVVLDHPEGIRALDIGNELGIDWRRVLGITTKLIDARMIEQVAQNFYPAGKASRR